MAGGGGAVGVGKDGHHCKWPDDSEWQALRQRGASAGWLADASEVEMGKEVGKGSFGTTYRGKWRGHDCAVKVVRVSTPGEATSFLREVAALSEVKHPNVMPFYGAVVSPPGQCWLLCEYMCGGTLAAWLYGPGADPRAGGSALWGPKRGLGERVEVALAVARGMAALEGARPPLLHRDLKPSNVFMDGSGAAVVADLGLARHVAAAGEAMTGETGTYFYMAPEVFSTGSSKRVSTVIQSLPYDGKADVFSWAILFAELLAAKPPYADLYLTPMQVAEGVAGGTTRPTLPKGLPPGLEALAQQAWHGNPALRPSFAAIVDTLTPLATEAQQSDTAAASAGGGGILNRIFGSAPTEPQQHHKHHHHPHLYSNK